jgi:uncharacterized protein (TIGR03435 family)
LEFEVASIHLSPPTKHGDQGIASRADGYTARYLPVKMMIALMYRIPARQVVGGPRWVEDDRYDVEARADGRYSVEDLDTMYKNMLAERFGLKFHIETKEENAYVLGLDKGESALEKRGSALKVSDVAQSYDFPINFSGVGEMHGEHVSMAFFCWMLGQLLQEDERPVVDMTGLKGFYDFRMSYLPQGLPEEERSRLPQAVLDRPSIFEALQEQLGLKLTAEKGPVQYFVIDHIERPSGN